MDAPDLRYPVGKFKFPEAVSADDRRKFVEQIAETPAHLRAAIGGLSDAQLDTPYRPEGWTVRQVIHHVPDSHLNSYMRFKLALTEDEPTIKPYAEDRWAELADGKSGPVEVSLRLLECLHSRWVALLRSLNEDPIGSGRFVIRTWACCGSIRMRRSMPGTAGTTWRTLPVCGTGWAGNRRQ